MKVLVTGGTGFIGRHLIRKLVEQHYEVISLDKKSDHVLENEIPKIKYFQFDLSYTSPQDGDGFLDEILKEVDVVFHLAGLLGTTELFHKIREAERVNVLGTLNLLEAMRRNGVTRIIFTSKPNMWKHNVYTITKENCERYLDMYREVFGFQVVVTRPFNVYGPEEPLSEYRKAIPYFIIAALRNEPLEIFGDGEQTMDVIYVEDVVEALIRCMRTMPQTVIEIGNGKPQRVVSLAQKIITMTGSKSEIVHLPMRKGEPLRSYICADISNMKRFLHFEPQTDLEEGLERTINWYKEHLNLFRNIYKFEKNDFIT